MMETGGSEANAIRMLEMASEPPFLEMKMTTEPNRILELLQTLSVQLHEMDERVEFTDDEEELWTNITLLILRFERNQQQT